MPLSIELKLEEREEDRLVVSVCVSPDATSHRIDGVQVALVDCRGVALGPKLLLPISGLLAAPLTTKAELRVADEIPRYSTIVATAWWDREQVQASCPSDPGTAFEFHIRGHAPLIPTDRGEILESVIPEERPALARFLPWLAEPKCCRKQQPLASPGPLEAEDTEDTAEEIVDGLGLDEVSARWLKDLLAEDPP